jgi:hypothetical protein
MNMLGRADTDSAVLDELSIYRYGMHDGSIAMDDYYRHQRLLDCLLAECLRYFGSAVPSSSLFQQAQGPCFVLFDSDQYLWSLRQ